MTLTQVTVPAARARETLEQLLNASSFARVELPGGGGFVVIAAGGTRRKTMTIGTGLGGPGSVGPYGNSAGTPSATERRHSDFGSPSSGPLGQSPAAVVDGVISIVRYQTCRQCRSLT